MKAVFPWTGIGAALDDAAEDLADRLVPEADAEDRDALGAPADDLDRDARVARGARAPATRRCRAGRSRSTSSTVIASFR